MSNAKEQTATVEASVVPWLSPDGAALVVVSGPDEGRTCPLPGKAGLVLTLGKDPTNGFVLTDPTVSRHHATLERTERGLRLRDGESRNGVRVGGVVVKEVDLEPGTLFQVGQTELIVKFGSRNAVVPPSSNTRFGLARGKSLAMRTMFGLLEMFAPGPASILLLGETGTGKDILARSIHAASSRASGPFEVVDCSAITPTLIESELFGHEKGAFTGAVGAFVGAFERANGGTVFLDELGELPLHLQPKLLRALEAREIRRVGGSKALPIDVRLIGATTRDIEAEVENGTFRRDLYFRLAVVPLHVPPLRARLEDIPSLIESIVGSSDISFGPEAIRQLKSYDWPGNVRELRNVVERATILAQASGESVIRDVAIRPPKTPLRGGLFEFEAGTTYREARARVENEFEAAFVAWLMEMHGGNAAAAARAAKMDRKYLGDLLRKHGLRG